MKIISNHKIYIGLDVFRYYNYGLVCFVIPAPFCYYFTLLLRNTCLILFFFSLCNFRATGPICNYFATLCNLEKLPTL